jgi:alpha-L-fucosidase
MMKHFNDGRDWFFEKRFGLCIHWGLYAIPAWHEQHQYRLRVPRSEYEKLIHQFNPTKFDPDAWLDLAAATGMEYVCFTTKHCDGFCLWNTRETDYNVMNPPYGKDVLKMLADACHRRGFPLCLYYSTPDMHCRYYPNANRSYELERPEPGDEPNLEKYIAFVKAQIRELCTQYGDIHGIWWDVNVLKHQDPSFNEMIRSLQPKAVINDRGFGPGDFSTPERDWCDSVNEAKAFENPVEACQSVGIESWGYREDEDYFTPKYLIQAIDNIMAKGGNYLLNVGPKADGTMPDEGVNILRTIGEWYHKVKESFLNTELVSRRNENPDICLPVKKPNILLTQREKTLYVHLFKDPPGNSVILDPINIQPRKATILNTGEPVESRLELLPSFYEHPKEYLRLRNLPIDLLATTVPVIKLEFDSLGS